MIELANKEYTTYVAACTVCYRIVDVVTVRARCLVENWNCGLSVGTLFVVVSPTAIVMDTVCPQ